ncbi:MAG: molybdopterin oxidoreductase [Nitrospirae bacterium GWD2_57_9]|nr:MAG: molybdopterin oxidoreductase [Nitrospirae bacterium GWD2_57_9]OGW45942.1 MAG: molybdopterin oxidoreductase [Nitrospirae bacterium GWC2_57_9]
MSINRRDFLRVCALGAVTTAGSRYFGIAQSAQTNPAGMDSLEFIRSTCSPNCTGACGFNAMLHKGRIQSLVQAADYPEKEYNPRGCLRGQSMLNLIYGPDRLKQPLIRAGKRGEGKFRAATWDEALDHVSDKLAGIMQKYGPESVAAMIQVPGTGYVHKGALMRLASMYEWSVFHAYTMNGDLPAFWPMTFGVQTEELESLEWTNSKYTMVLGSNVLVTRVPDAKFLNISREKGGKLVVVDPNYSPTASKADEWIQINSSTDAAFALGMVSVILSEKLYDEEFIKTNTDMPILVRLDDQKKLLASDVASLAGKAKAQKNKIPEYREQYVVYDKNTNGYVIPNPESLKRDFDPSLEGEFKVRLTSGENVKVKPVFQLLSEFVAREYTPDKAARIISPEESRVPAYAEMIKRIGREMGTIKPLHIVYGASNYQWFHGDLKGRALSLIVTLTGNLGKPGTGISTYAGQYRVRWPLGAWWGFKDKKNKWANYLLWMNDEYRESDEFKTYNKEIPHPKNGIKAFIYGWGNPFDQHNMSNRMREKATSGELELIVTTDFQMSTSCLWSDVVLPGVAWYEKYDLTATVSHPYVQLQQPAIEPLFQCMPEIWIFKEIAKRVARKTNNQEILNTIADYYPEPGLFRTEEAARKDGSWSLKLARRLAHEASLDAAGLMLRTGGPQVEGISVDMLKKGPIRLNLPTPGKRQLMFYEQIAEQQPFPPVSYPAPLPKTARFVKSGRIEFYKDEDVFIHTGETLPRHKDPFTDTENRRAGGRKGTYQLALITRNALYRVHSTHSNNITLLELQDLKPKVWLNPDAARQRGIREGDHVEAFNDRGRVYGYAVLDPGLHRQVAVFEEGWWSRYLQGTSYNTLTYPWIKAAHLIYFTPGIWEPTTAWNETACEVRKA